MIDLSFLTEEEQECILAVLQRDAELKKAEEKRVQNLQRVIGDRDQLKYMSGEWFYETKQLRHHERIHGADIIRASMRHAHKPPTLLELSHARQDRPSFVSSKNKEVFVPAVLQGVLQDPHIELSDDTFEILSQDAADEPALASVSPTKERRNPFNSEDAADFALEEEFEVVDRSASLAEGYDEAPRPLMTSLRELSSKIKSSSKSLENLASKTRKTKTQESLREQTNQSVEDVSTLPSSSDWRQLKGSSSVPLLQQDETDSDSTLDTNLGLRRNTGSSTSNLSLSSGLASMSSVSGSISSIYPADFGDIEVQGTVQFAMNYIQKLGEFHIFVVHCRDLAVADAKKNRSDPYVKCYLLPDKTKLGKRKTAVKKKTLNPDYNEILRFKVPMEVLKTQSLNISVWHNDTFGRNSFLGDVDVDLSEWDFSNTHINEYALKAGVSAQTSAPTPPQLTDGRGQMRVALRFLPQTANSQSSVKMETSEVQIWVKDCKNLPSVRGVVVDPFVKCAVLPDTSRKSKQKTRVVKRTANPMFNHTMVYDGFKPDDLKEACVEITVWDHDRLNNHYIGGVRLGPGTGKSYGVDVGWMDSTADEASLWHRMLQADGEWVEDVLPLRMLVMAKSKSK